MKVLLLTVTTGQGHNQTAQSLCKKLDEEKIENRYLDVFEYINPAIKEALSYGYLMSAKRFAKIYGKAYGLLEQREDKERHMLKITTRLMANKLIDYIAEFSPDVIVCTHVFAALLITAINHKFQKDIKTIGIITDFTIHPYWEDTSMSYYVTASELLNHQATKKGLAKEKILPIGIPIKPEFAEKCDKQKARELLGLSDKKTVLVMSGSMGYGKVEKTIDALCDIPLDFQLVTVCGFNEKLKKKIDKKSFSKTVINIGFTDKISLYMDAADCIITKPGGLTSSEALAKRLPMIMINPIPGQEDRNAEFLLNNGAALKISKTFPVDEAVFFLLSHTARLKNLNENLAFLGKPHSTEDFLNFIKGIDKK